jgi:hypothetical protein
VSRQAGSAVVVLPDELKAQRNKRLVELLQCLDRESIPVDIPSYRLRNALYASFECRVISVVILAATIGGLLV